MVAAGVAAFPCLACCLVAHLRTACVYGFMILGSMRTPCWLFARTRVDDAVYPIRREWSDDGYPRRIIFQQHVPVNPRSPTRSRKVASKSGRRLDCRVHELVSAVLASTRYSLAWLTPRTRRTSRNGWPSFPTQTWTIAVPFTSFLLYQL